MSQTTLLLNSKTVLVSQPYRALLGPDDELVGRTAEARMVLAAWVAQPGYRRLSPLLVGAAGHGKNRLVYEIARCTRKDLYVMLGNEDVTAEDLACTVRFSDDPQRKMDYVLSPLATAMLHGGICFIDEIGKLRARALAPLASVLDERRYLDSTLLGDRIPAHPGFAFIAATNATDLAGDAMPEYIRSRLLVEIWMDHPSRAELDEIVKRRFPRLERDLTPDRLLSRFWQLWRDTRGDSPPSARATLDLFALMLGLADAEAAPPEQILTGAPLVPVTPRLEHLDAAFQQLFGARA